MKAIFKKNPEYGGMELIEIPKPEPGDNDVLVKILTQ